MKLTSIATSIIVTPEIRRGARVADWDGLENRSRCKPTVGSNPTPSAPVSVRQCPRIRVNPRHSKDFRRGRETHNLFGFHVLIIANDRQVPTHSVPSEGKIRGRTIA